MNYREERLARNAESKLTADNDGNPWDSGELEWLQEWDRTEFELQGLAEILGRTIEACREQYYLRRRRGDWSAVRDYDVVVTSRPVCPWCFLVHGSAQVECS